MGIFQCEAPSARFVLRRRKSHGKAIRAKITKRTLKPLGGLLSISFVLGRWGVESLLAELGHGSKMRLPSPALSGWWLVLSAILVVLTFVAGVMGKI